LTFTNAAKALPVLHRIKDILAVKWNKAFEQAPNTCKTHSVLQATHSVKTALTLTHTDAHMQTSLGKCGQIKVGKHLMHLCNFIRGEVVLEMGWCVSVRSFQASTCVVD